MQNSTQREMTYGWWVAWRVLIAGVLYGVRK